jgi:hypothetical protein
MAHDPLELGEERLPRRLCSQDRPTGWFRGPTRLFYLLQEILDSRQEAVPAGTLEMVDPFPNILLVLRQVINQTAQPGRHCPAGSTEKQEGSADDQQDGRVPPQAAPL